MKAFLVTGISFVLMALSYASLISTCMWGCPNTGIQLVFKITSVIFTCLFGYGLYSSYRHIKNKKTTGIEDDK